jgi:VWFA-related protein
VFRGGTRLVQINVVVHDKHGQPVADLGREDFTLLERGKPQAISFFSMDTSAAATTSAAASASASASAPAPLESRTFSNTLADHGDVPGNVTAILIDLLNSAVGEQMRARDGLIKFLKQIEPHDRIAIFALTSHGLTLLHDYTTDAAALVERMRSAKPQIPTDLDASLGDASMQRELRDMGPATSLTPTSVPPTSTWRTGSRR